MKAFLNDLADWIPIFIFGGIVATISVVGALAPTIFFTVHLILQVRSNETCPM